MIDVERLLAEEDGGWRGLRTCSRSIRDDRFEEPTVTPEGWSPKDVMFHVGCWMADCAGVLERITAGTCDGGEDETPPRSKRRTVAWFEIVQGR